MKTERLSVMLHKFTVLMSKCLSSVFYKASWCVLLTYIHQCHQIRQGNITGYQKEWLKSYPIAKSARRAQNSQQGSIKSYQNLLSHSI